MKSTSWFWTGCSTPDHPTIDLYHDGLPQERYQLYHEEKAKGGIALTMTAGSAVVSRDSSPVFGNLHAYRDEIVPWLKRMADACGKRIVEMVWEDLTPDKILTEAATRNAVTVAMATGCSTNAIIHLIAMARRAISSADNSPSIRARPAASA